MLFPITDAVEFLVDTFTRNGISPGNARSVADALVMAEAAGQGGHGFRRVKAYVAQARSGKVNGQAVPVATRLRPAVVGIDAGHGFSFPAIDMAVDCLPSVAREQGIALATIGRSHHAGVLGLAVERFAVQGLVALMFANAPAAMAPWGGRKAVFGTNPIAFAVPVAGDEPLVIDMALSKVARGKIMAAQQKNAPIPEDWALDRDGNPTCDATEAMAGTMMPAGGPKGAALAMMVEVLSAALTGGNFAFEASSLFDDRGAPPSLGHTIIAIDPVASAGAGFSDRMAVMAQEISGQEGTRLPGRRGQGVRQAAFANGIVVDDEVVAEIRAL